MSRNSEIKAWGSDMKRTAGAGEGEEGGPESASSFLGAIARRIRLYEFDSHRDFLKALLKEAKSIEPKYDYLRFSEELGLGPNKVSCLLVHGKRKLTLKSAKRICDRLGFRGSARAYFLGLVVRGGGGGTAEQEAAVGVLAELRARHSHVDDGKIPLEFFARWHHGVVFELLGADPGGMTLDEIEGNLNPRIRRGAIEESLSLLASLGFVKGAGDPVRYKKLVQDVNLGDRIPGLAIVKYHADMLALARRSLHSIGPELREIASVSVSLNEAQIDRVKADLHVFLNYVLLLSNQSMEKTRVMQLNMQFFPLSEQLGRPK